MDERARQQALRERLSARSKKFLDSIDELHDLEERKRNERISTPEFHKLADTIVDRSREVFRLTTLQENLGEAIDTSDVSLNDVNPGDSHEHASPDERESVG
jgi:hypothetical protein